VQSARLLKKQHIQESTKQGNRTVARQIEAARRAALAKGEVGIREKKPVPTLEQFVPSVMTEIHKNCADHPRTAEFYQDSFNRALSFQPLAKAHINVINAEMLARFTTHQLKKVAPATVNRSLAAIRRALYLAQDWELIDRVPTFVMLKGERRREFVLSGARREEFIGGLPEPCQTIARFLVDTGLRIGECCGLTWDRVHISDHEAYIYIDRGKTKRATRYVPLTKSAQAILKNQRAISRSNFVFVRYGERVKKERWYKAPVSRHTVSEQFSNRRDQLGLPWDAVLHSTRHTALTDLGAAGADAFTIKQVAGHASVTTSERYVHPVPKVIQSAIDNLEKYRGQDAEKCRSVETSDSGKSPATISATVEKAESRYGVN